MSDNFLIQRDPVKDAWLGIDTTQDVIKNPFYDLMRENFFKENPHLIPISLFKDPEFLAYAVWVLFEVKLLPFQAVILSELWERPFPILVMTRGGSKTWSMALYSMLKALFYPDSRIVIAGAAFRQSKLVFEYCEKFYAQGTVYRSLLDSKSGTKRAIDKLVFNLNSSTITAIPIGCISPSTLITTDQGIKHIGDLDNFQGSIYSDNKFEDVGFFYNNGISDVYEVTTRLGLKYTGTPNHKMRVLENNEIVWKRTDELNPGDFLVVSRKNTWFNNPTFKCTQDQAYSLGLMLADGCMTNPEKLSFATLDTELIDVLNGAIGEFKQLKSKPVEYICCGKQLRQDWLDFWDMKPAKGAEKDIPASILAADKDCARALLQGLFDGDGCIYEGDRNTQSVIQFTNISYNLVQKIQYILLHFGIISNVSRITWFSKQIQKYCSHYNLVIRGSNIKKFVERVGFRLTRKRIKSERVSSNITSVYAPSDLVPLDKDLLNNFLQKEREISWKTRRRVKECKNLTRAIVNRVYDECVKNSIVFPWAYLLNEDLYFVEVKRVEKLSPQYTVDINVPSNNTYIANGFISHNTGEKIRGLRANVIIADEMDSMNEAIFETVIAGFGAVSSSPADNVIQQMEYDRLKELGKEDLISKWRPKSNQIIISGTCGYFFGPLFKYYKRAQEIINSQGDPTVLSEIFNKEVPEAFDWRDYSVIRIPYEVLPKGFMDEKMIARAKATMNSSVFDMEYSAVFVEDSDGFFKRSIIEGCVASEKNIDSKAWVSWCPSTFEPMQKGDPKKRYVYGVDPASERDNLAIVVLEVNDDHVKLAHVWTTNKDDYQDRKAKGFTSEPGYNSFVARKIRNLMRVFPCTRIAIDTQGGGYALMEALHDPKYIIEDEEPLWPIVDYDKPKESDNYAGIHIIEPVNFANYEWLYEANYGLLKDMETKRIIFPRFDSVSIDLSIIQDKQKVDSFEGEFKGKTIVLYDTMEDLFMEIEDLKDELTSIVISVAGTGVNGRFRWSVPEVQIEGNKKGRGRKDRYSALLMANSVARKIYKDKPRDKSLYEVGMGGLIQDIPPSNGKLYLSGPEWFTSVR